MLKTFNVYPKEGDSFSIQINKLDISEDGFAFFDEGYSKSTDGFLSFDYVAAIIPDKQSSTESEDRPLIRFNVYLKKRSAPLEIIAHHFDASQPPRVKFYIEIFRDDGLKTVELGQIYVDLSEVVGIFPVDGLRVDR